MVAGEDKLELRVHHETTRGLSPGFRLRMLQGYAPEVRKHIKNKP